jgi:RNA recognition motif-containing protein
MMDHVQNRSRGFGFVTFENGSNGAQKALEAQPIYIDGKYVELKLATPKGDQQKKTHSNTGLRNAAAVAAATSQPIGQFGGLAASYGRSGWKAGYGSYAFGSQGWAVDGWEDLNTVIVEKNGFSFDLDSSSTLDSLSGSKRGKRGSDYNLVEAKRPRVK